MLSRQFSPVDPLQPLADALRQTPADYFTAMRLAACHVFMLELLEAGKNRQKVLLVEDGGYVAPEFNRWVRQGATLGEAMERCRHDGERLHQTYPDLPLDRPLGEWLDGVLAGGVEHTRNGYDQLMQVKAECGGLAFPVYSIAMSNYKNREEGRDAAASILMACEYIMSGQGDSLYYRNAITIGSRGHIGRCLLKHLNDRLAPGGSIGVDIVIGSNPEHGLLCEAPEYRDFASIPPNRLRHTDLVIGMTAQPVLSPVTVRDILLRGSRRRLYLVSGSTKNVEFKAVLDWLQTLSEAEHPSMEEWPVRIETRLMIDPLTEISQGTIIRVVFTGGQMPPGVSVEQPFKEIFLAGDGMPLNFNFFGVPGETMDEVMRELLLMCRLAMRQPHWNNPDVYALDINMDETGSRISRTTGP